MEADPRAAGLGPAQHRGHGSSRAGCIGRAHRGRPGVPDLDGSVDLVVSNPPYVADAEAARPEVARPRARSALYAGVDGLDALRVVERVGPAAAAPRRVVVVEHGDSQGAAAPASVRRAGTTSSFTTIWLVATGLSRPLTAELLETG